MVASALFVGAFTIEGWLRPGYGPLREYVSALSISLVRLGAGRSRGRRHRCVP
jgi:hypothetical protein